MGHFSTKKKIWWEVAYLNLINTLQGSRGACEYLGSSDSRTSFAILGLSDYKGPTWHPPDYDPSDYQGQGWICHLPGARENITVCGVAPVPASTHRVSYTTRASQPVRSSPRWNLFCKLTRALERVWESRALERGGGRFCPSLLSQLLQELESPNLVSEKTRQWTLWCAILVTLGQYFKGQMGSSFKKHGNFRRNDRPPLTPV